MPPRPDLDQLPIASPLPTRLKSFSLVWIVPILAAAVGIGLGAQTLMKAGPTVTVTFDTAEGLEAGKTKIRYKSVDIGEVKTITLSKDRNQVLVTAELVKDAEDLLVADSQLWVVKPRVSGGEVSGISTLFSGSYIALKAGTSEQHKHSFIGLETAPIITGNTAGRQFQLVAADLGSLEVGSPVYYRHIRVGEIVAYKMEKNGQNLLLDVFVHAPYHQYVTRDSRFWNASGVEATMDSKGVEVRTESLVSILSGGITFETPAHSTDTTMAEADHSFILYRNRPSAMQTPNGKPQIYKMYFSESLRGLTPGATVEFQGIPIGEVLSVEVRFNEKEQNFSFPVTVAIYENQLGLAASKMPTDILEKKRRQSINTMVSRGLRSQLRTGSLLTGQLYISFGFFPDSHPAHVDWSQSPPQLPTIPGTGQILEQNVTNILKKAEKMPLDQIGIETRNALSSLNLMTQELKKTLSEINQTISPDSPLQRELRRTLNETTRSVQAVRELADTLEGEPESLLKGKKSGDSE